MLEVYLDETQEPYFPFGFHLSREAWETYGIKELLQRMRETGNRNMSGAVRQVASAFNTRRVEKDPLAQPIRGGSLMAAGLLTEVLYYVAHHYCTQQCRGVMERALMQVRDAKGFSSVDRPIRGFVELFPPTPIMMGEVTPERYLEKWTAGMPNDCRTTVEMALLHLALNNPAMKPFHDLFDDTELRRRTNYQELVGQLDEYFETQEPVAPFEHRLFSLWRLPSETAPESLEDQLQYIADHWSEVLPPTLLQRLLVTRDIIREETLMRGMGRGENQAPRFGRGKTEGLDETYPEPERFTQDADWMANVVLLAKSVYVWLDQLSRRYQRTIARLDQIPDEELDLLARWGITGVWLIGVWERSQASAEIKRQMGNPEAMASAYSLHDYVVAEDLGGEAACDNLRERAWRRGIRLASDMVPNHVGLYSRWVIEHPDWFVQSSHPPFPGYSFTGPNLSPDGRVSLFIEDGYWNHSEAAVVFKRVDNHTGDVRYIYHGNDGTSMPWNDTAQLNFLLPEVREAVIQTILHVARQFSIIRFDAAMTLSKKHFQRLWYPKPGEGGAIPSRAEHGMSRQEFDQHMPEEFWRMVVDRVQEEQPETLLLAEAFWLMEGYFVRTLGMHRVYNSAFMNMLKMEENSKYRDTMKNMLEFSPQILKRLVNFMNNPDELTAVEQFGKGDKYFGVCAMMVTMPGLPMIGHGQIEGFTEKYGMEYRRAYWDERPDEGLIQRHEQEIFPLMRRRYLFSHADHFALYDFYTPDGHVDENVFAYSNRAGNERAVVIYNNAYNTTSGWVRTSTRINKGSTDSPEYYTTTLGEVLGMRTEEPYYYMFRDHRTGLEYIRHGVQLMEQGLFVSLQGYQYHAFLDFCEVYDHDGTWGQLTAHLAGAGVQSVDNARKELLLAPVLEPMRKALGSYVLTETAKAAQGLTTLASLEHRLLAPLADALQDVCREVGRRDNREIDGQALVAAVRADLNTMLTLEERIQTLNDSSEAHAFLRKQIEEARQTPDTWRILTAWIVLGNLGKALYAGEEDGAAPPGWLENWRFTTVVREKMIEASGDEQRGIDNSLAAQLLVEHDDAMRAALAKPPRRAKALSDLFNASAAQQFCRIHEHEGVVWLNKEQTDKLMHWFFVAETIDTLTRQTGTEEVSTLYAGMKDVLRKVEQANFQVKTLLELMEEPETTSASSEPVKGETQ
ncbi:MAG: alpha-amylase family glycosyl hydrolase [Candidatus Hydrogenedentota bacterium]